MTQDSSTHPIHDPVDDPLIIAGKAFTSRLIIGTGKYPSFDDLRNTIDSTGAQIVTVALRRVSMGNQADRTLNCIDTSRIQLLPNTSGARDAAEAVRLARMARAASGHNWVKLEVTPDPVTLLPDPVETFKAAQLLIEDGFVVLPYISADPILARQLQEMGCATVMPLAAPIGTNKGLLTREFIRTIVEQATVPVVVDAGLGAPSHAAAAMELGVDAVMLNTALSTAANPPLMGQAFRLAVEAGRRGYLAGLGRVLDGAVASSPETDRVGANDATTQTKDSQAEPGPPREGATPLTGFLDS